MEQELKFWSWASWKRSFLRWAILIGPLFALEGTLLMVGGIDFMVRRGEIARGLLVVLFGALITTGSIKLILAAFRSLSGRELIFEGWLTIAAIPMGSAYMLAKRGLEPTNVITTMVIAFILIGFGIFAIKTGKAKKLQESQTVSTPRS
ncbi:MAG: hypothetical protein Q7S28_03850 [bacterium]|nr:hypothetical protein [bacterium]